MKEHTLSSSEKRESRVRMGILPKILLSFLCLSIIPLVLAGYFAIRTVRDLGSSALKNTEDMGQSVLESTKGIQAFATKESVEQLDKKSTENIEVRTIDAANRIADLLHGIDDMVRSLCSVPRTPEQYLAFYNSYNRNILVPSEYVWDREAKQWAPTEKHARRPDKGYRLEANKKAWHYNPPLPYKYEPAPLFKEITFYDVHGQERLKVENGGISENLLDIRKASNTFCKTEDYFARSQALGEGDFYVSPVVSTYELFWGGKPGVFNPDEHPDKNPRDYAYAGRENPLGRRSEGVIRWVTPIYEKGKKIGYVTAALDNRHIQELVEHIHPTPKRFTELHDPGSGNYAFVWDNNHRAVAHPRDYFECGYDPKTGEPIPGWTSGQKLEQLKSGKVPLDGRVLDFAPQCKGWANITEDGGNGSFQILWSGLYKLTTVAAIPYYTGANYSTPRGFGYVTIGANVDDFHKAALLTGQSITHKIEHQRELIGTSLTDSKTMLSTLAQRSTWILIALVCISAVVVLLVSSVISLSITKPVKQLSKAAASMAAGDLDQQVTVKSNDELKNLADTFNIMAENVRQVDQMKSEFVTVASHEFRTPIHGMTIGVSAILDGYCGDITSEVREDLVVVNEGIMRLNRLIEGLLDLSRIESGKIELEQKLVSMEEIINDAVAEVSDLAKTNDHTVVVSIKDAGEVTGDKDRLTQAIVNLVGNSIKYTPKHGTIQIGLEATADFVSVSVADNGYGIPAEAQEKVFERFFQADSLMSKTVGGTGLGLSITKGLVEQHGGQISVTSPLPRDYPGLEGLDGNDRKGTLFTVMLPPFVDSNETQPEHEKTEHVA